MMPRRAYSGEQNPVDEARWQDLLRHVLGAGLLTAPAAWLLAGALGLGPAYLAAVGTALVAGTLLLLGLREPFSRAHPHAAFGPANRVTLARAVGVGLLAGLAFEPETDGRAWSAIALATLAAVLDGVDGRLARRSGLASRFGARFDMETDALMILVLAILAWRWDRAGAWVLCAGLMRYGFVLAARAWPWLAAELAPSRRRQAVCVVQIVGLIVALLPWLSDQQSVFVAASSLAALCYSFALDVRDLARRRTTEGFTT